MGSSKRPGRTSYRSSIDTIALKCLVFEKIVLFAFWRQTDEQMDSTNALSRSRCRERQLNKCNIVLLTYTCINFDFYEMVAQIPSKLNIYPDSQDKNHQNPIMCV